MASNTISSGIPVLDQALHHGGFKKGSIVLLIGDHSSRKDLFGLTFLREGLLKGEKAAFYDIEASSDEIMDLLMESTDVDILKNLRFVDACPEYSKFFINAVPARIIEDMRRLDPLTINRVLINPFTFFIEKFGLEDSGDLLIMIRDIAIKKKLTVMFLMADILDERKMQSVIDKFDGIIELRTVEIHEGTYHTLDIKKFSSQQKRIQLTYNTMGVEVRITSTGRII
ncbi:MAG: ATPase domain-containing protein [Candidatus Thermoplasmatota archaeon]|nr:ATPase domain-containing protein [Candidatus Thermoplasmatota archaeon]